MTLPQYYYIGKIDFSYPKYQFKELLLLSSARNLHKNYEHQSAQFYSCLIFSFISVILNRPRKKCPSWASHEASGPCTLLIW